MGSVLASKIRCLSGVCSVYVRLFNVLSVRRGKQMEWLRCEDSSNLFKTPKSVQCCQTGKLKSLINLYYFEIIYRVSVISRRPSLPSLPKSGAGEGGEGRRSCTNYTFKTIKMHTCISRYWHNATGKIVIEVDIGIVQQENSHRGRY